MRRNNSDLLRRLLVDGRFGFKFLGSFSNFLVKFVLGFAKFAQTFAESASQIGNAFRTKKQQNHQKNDDNFTPAEGAKCEQRN